MQHERLHFIHQIFSHRVLVTINFAIVISIVGFLGYLYYSEGPKSDVNFQVENGDSIQKVASRLEEQGVIKHKTFFLFNYFVFGERKPIAPGGYQLSSTMKVKNVVHALEGKPSTKFVVIPEGLNKEQMAKLVGHALDWGDLDSQFFSHTYAGMQWQHYEQYIREYFQQKFSWNDKKTETFLTLSSLYYDKEYDFLKNMYEPGTYELPGNATRAQVAGIFIDQFVKNHPDDSAALRSKIDQKSAGNIAKLIDEQMVLMPDIVAMPPRDIVLKKQNGRVYLQFTTAYWNKGRGPLEFVADPKTKGQAGDLERNVFQRIYSLDGDYTEKLSGVFLWHAPHLHYHFKDFAVYHFEPIAVEDSNYKEVLNQKSTFCIRDSEPIDLAHPGAQRKSTYNVCGKERQGISPGWADSYFYNYVDQKIDVTNAPKGEYRLSLTINPLDRFQEITKDNNVGEAIISLDADKNFVKVIKDNNHGI